jgi:hypothetical protein
VDIKRGLLSKDMQKTCEFILEYKEDTEVAVSKPVPFSITPDTIQNIGTKEVHL